MRAMLRSAVALALLAVPAAAQTALRIGPTFGAELAAAGCAAGVAWAPDGTLTLTPGADPVCPNQVLAAHDPTKISPRTASAKQVRYALNDLGVRTAWNAAVAASDQGGQDYWAASAPVFEGNAKIVKWCAAVGITSRQLFDRAVTE